MPQETNLNVSPYYDDFNEEGLGAKDKGYYKVLFKPGYPVQARELTGMQSILQNQIEQFANHTFKEGAKVIPGNTIYINQYFAVELQDSFLGIPISLYFDKLVGLKIRGLVSGVEATVKKVLNKEDSERNSYTLYVSYERTGEDNETSTFDDSETLILVDNDITFSNTFISAGEGFANTISTNATSVGSAFGISQGVYYVRGHFVDVDDEVIILDQYTNTPSYRVGLRIEENIITPDIDETLTDNAKGFNNYTAPGADRLQIKLSLQKKELDDLNDRNFVPLTIIEDGIIRSLKTNTEYNLIADEFARRTYEESGDYYITPFSVSVRENLNNGFNNGVFGENQRTYSGNTPSESLGVYEISPGKAFVKGYEIETVSPTFIDFKKPRETKTLEDQSIAFNTGFSLKLNRVAGAPQIGIGNTFYVSLRDSKLGSDSLVSAGNEIGIARVYDFYLESGSYNTTNLDTNEWKVSLYDVQPFTKVTLSENTTIPTSTYVTGKSSGAVGFAKTSLSSSKSLTLYQTKGRFIVGEQLDFDGESNTRISVAVTAYGLNDCKSVYGNVGVGLTFNADIVQVPSANLGVGSITSASGGISTITSPNSGFKKYFTIGNLISYNILGDQLPRYGKISSISDTDNQISIEATTSVSGISVGSLPTTPSNIFNISILGSTSSETGRLFTVLPKKSISDVNLENSFLTVRKSESVTIDPSGVTNTISASANESFLPFDEERYTLISSDGNIQPLSSDRLQFNSNFTTLTIKNLTTPGNATLVSTRRVSNIKNTNYLRKNVTKLVVDKSKLEGSGIGSTTLDNGLVYGNYPYGTRVEDLEICLNVPDVLSVYAVYESEKYEEPSAPKLTLSSFTGPNGTTEDLVLGEVFKGLDSGAVGLYVENINSGAIAFIQQGSDSFVSGETIEFNESKVNAVISNIETVGSNINQKFIFDSGQRANYIDYSRLIRNKKDKAPTRKIAIYFLSAYYEDSETGDITTVNSYNSFSYSSEIPAIFGFSNSDILDARPRVAPYVVTESIDSPFDFNSRKFADSVNHSKHILATDETSSLTFSYYLPRIDRIFLNKNGDFQLKYGTPSDDPEMPSIVDDAIEIARVTLPAYLATTSKASIQLLEYKRYRMQDIKKLEDRIKNLEYYTTLSLLEKETKNMLIPDSEGFNKFKSGFFVDNFTTLSPQERSTGIKNSIDTKYREIRPAHYTSAVDLQLSTVSRSSVDDISTLTSDNIVGNNIKFNRGVITLDYTNKVFLRQSFATRTENLTPFLVTFWEGTISLSPSSDIWVDKTRLEPKTIVQEGNYSATLQQLSKNEGFDPQTGFGPVIWGSWQTISTGVSKGPLQTSTTSSTSTSTSTNWVQADIRHAHALQAMGDQAHNLNQNAQGNLALGFIIEQWDNPEWMTVPRQNRAGNWVVGFPNFAVEEQTTTVTQNTTTTVTQNVTTSTNQIRTGQQQVLVEQWDYESLGEREISKDLIPYMRSRNVEFIGKRFKPYTKVYPFFDGIDMSKFVVPKLINIKMANGTFRVGETVKTTASPGKSNLNKSQISFRVARSNHKYGAYNNPDDIYTQNPYNSQQTIPSSYSSTSTILNVDTFSLADAPDGNYRGYISKGDILVGQTSGAVAVVQSVDLITDFIGTVIGTYFIPDPNGTNNPKFAAGTKKFKLTSSSQNSSISGTVTTSAEESFTAQGTLMVVQETILAIRNARLETRTVSDSQTLESTETVLVSQNTTSSVISTNSTLTGTYKDPLAQSFAVDEPNGVFVTQIDIYFATKDPIIPATLQLRTMQLGTPTRKILPFSEITIDPKTITTSNNASVATTIKFDAPVYLKPATEYCVVLMSESTEYNVWISRLGEIDVSTRDKPESQQILVSTQPILGSLFKSQNASTWDPSQYEDLKFTLYRAEFKTTGNVQFENPPSSVNNGLTAKLRYESLRTNSKSVVIGAASSITDSLTIGNTIIQSGSRGSGNLVGIAGSATGTLTNINSGIGYTPASGSYVYNNIVLNTISGYGNGARANVTIKDGVAIAATISNSYNGSGYIIGDVVELGGVGLDSLGTNARFSISQTSNNNSIIVDNVSGEFKSGSPYEIKYINSLGVTTAINTGGWYPDSINTIAEKDGKTMTVFHKNHGMHYSTDIVEIRNVSSDVPPLTTLDSEIFNGNTISVTGLTTNFSTFEGVGVGTTNPGYALINDEIISYSGVTANSLTGVTRGIDNTQILSYANVSDTYTTQVYKYEFNGVSLRRINTNHTLSQAVENSFDEYDITIDMTDAGKGGTLPQGQVDRSTSESSGFPSLYFNVEKNGGGSSATATQNLQYQLITPNVHTFTVSGTSVSAALRTVSGTTPGSLEPSFVDQGFQDITLNEINYFNTPRLICSKVNEDNNLINSPNNKSLTLNLSLSTVDTKVSPVIDKERVLMITTSNRIDNQITNWIDDPRVNTLLDDPSSFQYVTKPITLSTPAKSLKVLFDAYVNVFSDVRVLYSISNSKSGSDVFTLFPGYLNINKDTGEIINPGNNDGTPDNFIEKSTQLAFDSQMLPFTEYEFTADPLPEFTTYRIKVVFSGTNQAYPPRMREFRTIALA